ncbi:unnamed protein product [Oikopleura dioica]|uniref:Uncharacterized protein n=1 Tax=Oikopleura dioica TaxID=34765 RepID=E4YFL5_OIKDI|nr:unnamed protein product [Oikopleura dioica]
MDFPGFPVRRGERSRFSEYEYLWNYVLQLVTKCIEKCARSEKSSEKIVKKKSEYFGLLFFLIFSVVIATLISAQMCITGSKGNATSTVIEFSFLRTTFYISRGIYVYQFFPESQFGMIYAIISVATGTLQFAIDPLFKLIQNGGDVNFVPVSAALAASTALCFLQPLYNWFTRKNYIETSVDNEEDITEL